MTTTFTCSTRARGFTTARFASLIPLKAAPLAVFARARTSL